MREDGVLFLFHPTGQLHVLLDGVSRRLCGRFTDYSWYLSRIVCPLEAAGYNIHEVVCCDDDN